ncbi:DUF1376 domain-containing protein [Methylobacterium fujisawaense]|jgi:uncharacterized protein YdaU (DUF1376 family)
MTATELPPPLVPLSTDISGLPAFMLDVERLFASELWALSTGEEFKAAVALWGRAWQQTPAGSLPNDDRLLAAFSGAGARWKKVREMALRGFVLCADGRYYHRVLCEDVLRASQKKEERRQRTLAASRARRARDGDEPTPPSGGKKLNENSETPHRNDERNDHRNGARHDERNDDRHEHRHDVRHEHRDDDVTTTVTRSHRQDRTGQKKEDSRPGQACEPVPGETPRRAAPATDWATRENFDRVEARCRAALPDRGPQDPQIGPMARLEADGYDLEAEILPALLDAAAAARTPVRTWRIWADRVAERINAQRLTRASQGLPATPAAPVAEEDKIDLGAPFGRWAEPVLRTAVAKHREMGGWVDHLWGPPPGQPGCKIPPRLLIVEAA